MKRTEWHRWFAWHPVKLESGGYVWMQFVQRRMYKFYDYTEWWIYRK